MLELKRVCFRPIMKGAVKDIDEALKIEPTNQDLLEERAYVKELKSDFGNAMRDYDLSELPNIPVIL